MFDDSRQAELAIVADECLAALTPSDPPDRIEGALRLAWTVDRIAATDRSIVALDQPLTEAAIARDRGGGDQKLPLAVMAALCVPAAPAAAAATREPGALGTAIVNLANRAIAYDDTRDVLLVAVAQSVPVLGNSLVEINPHTGALGRSVPVGSDPNVIAVADDGSRAYVGLLGSSTITEVNLTTFSVTRDIDLGSAGFFGPRYAEDIEVQPGAPGVIAVSLQYDDLSPRHGGVAVYDGGVMRPTTTPVHTGANRLTWGDQPGTLYGYNNETTGFQFYRLTVNAGGVTVASTGSAVSGFGVDIEFSEGRIQATNGRVVDPASLTLDGAYTTAGMIEADPAQDKTFFLNGSTLSRHNTVTQLQDWSRTVPSIGPTSLVDAGNVLAAAGANAILLIGAGVTSSGYDPPEAPVSIVQVPEALTFSLALAEIVSSPDGSRIYGVARQAASQYPGEVVEIDTAERER